MKYLKYYEFWPASEGEGIIEEINSWMKNKGILNIEFEPPMEGNEFFETIHSTRPVTLKKIFFIPEDSEEYGHGYTWSINIFHQRIELETLTDETLQKILNYLNAMTPEEINDILAEQESEKFNF